MYSSADDEIKEVIKKYLLLLSFYTISVFLRLLYYFLVYYLRM